MSIQADDLAPHVTWGTRPADALPVTARLPDPADAADTGAAAAMRRSLDYMGLRAGMAIEDIAIDWVFIGSCTNGRIEDLRAAAAIAQSRRVSDRVRALVVPGSGLVKQQAEAEGLHRVLIDAGFDWREPGCSLCIALKPRPPRPRRTLRRHLQPQFRKLAGPRRTDTSCQPVNGGGDGCDRALDRSAGVWVTIGPLPHTFGDIAYAGRYFPAVEDCVGYIRGPDIMRRIISDTTVRPAHLCPKPNPHRPPNRPPLSGGGCVIPRRHPHPVALVLFVRRMGIQEFDDVVDLTASGFGE